MDETIFDYVVAQEIAAYWETRQAEQGMPPYLGDILFPSTQQLGLELSYIKGAKGMPVELNLSAFDAKSVKRNRIGFSEVRTRMPFFKNSMSIDEELRQKLLIAIQAGNRNFIDKILSQIFQDNIKLIEDAAVTREKMRMQLISTGTIVMANNGQEYNYDYKLPASHKVTPDTVWSDANADPIADITKWQDVIENEGYGRPTRAITSRSVLRNLMKNANIKNAVYVFSQGKVALNENALRAYIADQTGVTIEVYEKKYIGVDGVATRFIAEDLFILIPEGNLGETVFGTTPEEADLMGSGKANVSLVDTGVAVTTTEEVDPVSVTTKVSQICMPSFEAADQIIIADVQ